MLIDSCIDIFKHEPVKIFSLLTLCLGYLFGVNSITMLGLLGINVSYYAIKVEHNARLTGKNNSMCDFNDKASCSRVLTSEYSRIFFNVPNTWFGFLFYLAVCIYPMWPFILIPYREMLFFMASTFSIMFSGYLAFVLYFKLQDVCVVCIASWIINAMIFYHSYYELFY